MELPTFNGDPAQFDVFWDANDSAVHSMEDLDETYKFDVLRKLLSGSAKAAIEGLTVTSGNYTEAASILRQRYGNKAKVRRALHMRIHQLGKVANNADKLRKAYDCISNTLRQLQSMNEDVDVPPLINSVMAVLLKSAELEVCRIIGSEYSAWTMEDVLKAF